MYKILVPYAQKDPGFLFEKRRGQPREFWSLVSTIDGSTHTRTVWKNSYAKPGVTDKTYNKNKNKKTVLDIAITLFVTVLHIRSEYVSDFMI